MQEMPNEMQIIDKCKCKEAYDGMKLIKKYNRLMYTSIS